jgi:hypothetical protein
MRLWWSIICKLCKYEFLFDVAVKRESTFTHEVTSPFRHVICVHEYYAYDKEWNKKYIEYYQATKFSGFDDETSAVNVQMVFDVSETTSVSITAVKSSYHAYFTCAAYWWDTKGSVRAHKPLGEIIIHRTFVYGFNNIMQRYGFQIYDFTGFHPALGWHCLKHRNILAILLSIYFSAATGTSDNIVAFRPLARQRPRNKQIDKSQ